jgi:hypothetical protein
MTLLAESGPAEFEGGASVEGAAVVAGQASTALLRQSVASPLRLQVPCAAIGAIFAAADAAAMVLASLAGAAGYQLFISGAAFYPSLQMGAGVTAAVLYLMIGRSSGFYQVADIFSQRRVASRIVWQWLLTSLLRRRHLLCRSRAGIVVDSAKPDEGGVDVGREARAGSRPSRGAGRLARRTGLRQ